MMRRIHWTYLLVLLAVGPGWVYAGCESSSSAKSGPATSEGSDDHHGGDRGGHSHGASEEGEGREDDAHSGGGGDKHTGHEGGDGQIVKLTKKAQKQYDVETKKARAGRLASHVSAPASVIHAPSQKYRVSPLVNGRIFDLKVTVGDRVEEGETLAVLRSIELGKARAEVQEAKAKVETTKANLERAETLEQEGIVSERRYLEAKTDHEKAKADLSGARSELQTYGVGGGEGPFYALTSEIDGRVIEQKASEGEVKGPSDAIFVVADTSPVWVIGEVFERDISKVEKGMEATVTLEAYPSRTWRGTVDWVADTVDDETRNLDVRVALPNQEGEIHPGMFGGVHLEAKRPGEVALVPVGAVQKVHGQRVVFVPGDTPRRYEARSVQTGDEGHGMVEIRTGLKPGDEYVTKGAFDLRATLTAASRSGGHHH